ncbi:GTPase Era [Helicobacter sp. 16-1353]|uniref:GTPase Era n=1 Tax=Helicobacter sp. 16-1353 TaxID=2004996 RepID=UPI000DCB8C2F|nr:GTPase Era [Helicobacter sp. 16-1353]RAX55177.1 GTPase Era [Helicobacter sp. 16-1353]
MSKAGFVAIIGRPNAGKSTLLNALINEQIALVSHKINATRKRMNIILMHKNSQIIFIDTPGIHNKEKMLNQFMLQESLKAIDDCDLVVFLSPITDNLRYYEEFLELNKKSKNPKKHILLLTKIDSLKNDEILESIAKYEVFKDFYHALIPISSTKNINLANLLDEVVKYLPNSPYLYDTEIISDQNLREIYKEKIRESVFENINKEIPYQSDVIINKIEESEEIDRIYAQIIVEKESQKIIIIGKNGNSIKNIGINARKKIEDFSGKRAFLKLEVIVKKGWSKNKKLLKEIGYNIN